MGTTLILLRDMYLHVGPGIILAFAMPLLLALLSIIVAQIVRRARNGATEASETA